MQVLLAMKESIFDFTIDALQALPSLPMYMMLIFITYGAYIGFLREETAYLAGSLRSYMDMPNDEDRLLLKLGIKSGANKYRVILYAACLLIFLAIGGKGLMDGDPVLAMSAGVILGGFVFLLSPREELCKGVRSPLVILVEKASVGRKKALESELFNSVTTLKNLAIAQENDPVSADLMLEKLMENSKKLKPIFAKVITIYRQGDRKRAFRYFSDAIDTRNARTFALILEKIDAINPTELKTQVVALQEVMMEERYTKGMESAENKGNLIYGLATACGFICLLNFVFVCVLSDALSMLGDIF